MATPGSLDKTDLIKIALGSGVAISGSTVAASLIENIKPIADYAAAHASTWGFVVGALGILVNVIRKLIVGSESEPVSTPPAA